MHSALYQPQQQLPFSRFPSSVNCDACDQSPDADDFFIPSPALRKSPQLPRRLLIRLVLFQVLLHGGGGDDDRILAVIDDLAVDVVVRSAATGWQGL